MKQKFIILFVLLAAAFFIPYYAQAQATEIFRQEGIASWYGKEFEGRPTASGEIYDSSQLTAAHPNLPFGTMLIITNQHNNKKVTVRVNDRGPFVAARVIDVSKAAAEQLDMIITGTAPVLVESIERIVVSPPPVVEPVQTPSPAVETPSVITPAPVQEALPANTTPIVQAPEAVVQQPAVTYVQQPLVAAQASYQVKLIPETNIAHNKMYRLQVGSYKVARNAVDAFEKLKNAGLNPSYERYADGGNSEYFRVVLAGISGTDVQLTVEKIGAAGFREALIREER